MLPRRTLFFLAVLAAAATGCRQAEADRSRVEPKREVQPALAATPYEPSRLLLSGELVALKSSTLTVPQTPTWMVQIRWLAQDGGAVKKGDIVAEFDNSTFAATLEEKRLALTEAEAEQVRVTEESRASETDKLLEVERKRIGLSKAKLEAAVPLELRSRREHEEKQLALKKAEAELQKALTELEGFRKGAEADEKIREIAIEKARREIRTTEAAVDALTLRAPEDGLVVIGDTPRDRRKIQVGDQLWPGVIVARLPDLSGLRVEASLYDVDDGRLEPGMTAIVTADAFADRPMTGRVEEVAAVAQQPTNDSLRRVFRVVLSIAEKPFEGLRPGLSAKVEIPLRGAGEKETSASAPSAPAAPAAPPPGAEPFAVKRDELVVGAEMRGALQALDSDQLGVVPIAEVWDYKISRMAPEGAAVKKGQPVLWFDTNEHEQKLLEKIAEGDAARKQIEKREKDLLLREKEVDLQLAEAESRKRKAELKVDVPAEIAASKDLALARLDLEQGTIEMESLTRKKVALKASATAELAILESRKDRADLRVKQLRDGIAAQTVKAPRDGTILYLSNWRDEKKKVGDSCWRGEKVMEVPDLTRMGIRAEVDESDGGRLTEGQTVTFRLDSNPDQELSGKVTRILRTVQRQSPKTLLRVFRFDVTLDAVDSVKMRPGMRVRGRVELARVPGVLLVPNESIFASAKGPVVFRRAGGGWKAVPVTVGRRGDDGVEVTGGLSEGDRVARPTKAGKGA